MKKIFSIILILLAFLTVTDVKAQDAKKILDKAATAFTKAGNVKIGFSANVNGNNAASVSSAVTRKLELTVSKAGNYIISFSDETTTSGCHEFLLLEFDLTVRLDPSGITMPTSEEGTTGIWSLTGTRRSAMTRGLNIIRTADGKTRKIYVK